MNYEEFEIVFNQICKKINIEYKDISKYREAFTHPTYANENKSIKGIKDYERLEFLGDALLDFIVGEYLFDTRNFNEGDMSKLRAKYVCEAANAFYVREFELDKCILLGVGAMKTGEGKKDSVLGNIFESFIAAMYLDQGIDYVKEFFKKNIFPKIDANPKGYFVDYKSELQEKIQAERVDVPTYVLVNSTGPAHDRTFEVMVKVADIKLGRGSGKSKEKAEQAAAKDALDKLAIN